MVKKINALEGVFSTFSAMADQTKPDRRDFFRDELGNIIVDTVEAFDTGMWETGIQRKGKNWIIVEQYESRNQAGEGHEKWVKNMKENPKMKLKDIDLWDIGIE